MKKQTKIAVFFGGKISQHLVMLKKAAKKLGERLDLVSYNRVSFDSESGKVIIRGNINDTEGRPPATMGRLGTARTIKNEGWLQINDYDVLFFRTTGKHWEEVDLIMDGLNPPAPAVAGTPSLDKEGRAHRPIVVDPIIEHGKPSMACKAYQMLALKKAGIDVPKTVYGSLWYLYEVMKGDHEGRPYNWPVIIKGSGGDRGMRVYKAENLEEMEKLVLKLRRSEIEEGKRYMLQEYIENDGDYRVLVLGKKVLGVMKRCANQNTNEFRNNYSAGGTVEVAELPEEIKKLAVRAAEVCGLWVAGVDVAFRDFDMKKPVIWEVNKGPQFKGFMKATGVDVPREMVKFLKSLSASPHLPLKKGRKN